MIVRENPCLNCKKPLNAASGTRGEAEAGPSDLTICAFCGHLMFFCEDMSFRELTADEREMVMANEDVKIAIKHRALMLELLMGHGHDDSPTPRMH